MGSRPNASPSSRFVATSLGIDTATRPPPSKINFERRLFKFTNASHRSPKEIRLVTVDLPLARYLRFNSPYRRLQEGLLTARDLNTEIRSQSSVKKGLGPRRGRHWSQWGGRRDRQASNRGIWRPTTKERRGRAKWRETDTPGHG